MLNPFFFSFTFIKNIPNRSQQSRPVSAVRDIPPKTRSTPAATLVLDLVSVIWLLLDVLIGCNM